MSKFAETKVFILGAGCSVECGYPPGTGFGSQLESFLNQLPADGGCPTIRQSVTDTIEQFRRHPGAETLDQLAAAIDPKGNAHKMKEVVDAKIATSAMFLYREAEARKTGLKKYKQFLTTVLGGGPCHKALANCNSRVLSFNYDRLFEIAFLTLFSDFDSSNCTLYGEHALNSGFHIYGNYVGLIADRFCFLKLHGSVGWWARYEVGGGRRYSAPPPQKAMSLPEIEASIPKQQDLVFGSQPLIAFPGERQASQTYEEHNGKSSDYLWAPYIDRIWKDAAALLTNATEVRVIGYSFDPTDSRAMVEKLLSKTTNARTVIQNTVDVRQNLASYSGLRCRLDYDPTPFGEFPTS